MKLVSLQTEVMITFSHPDPSGAPQTVYGATAISFSDTAIKSILIALSLWLVCGAHGLLNVVLVVMFGHMLLGKMPVPVA